MGKNAVKRPRLRRIHFNHLHLLPPPGDSPSGHRGEERGYLPLAARPSSSPLRPVHALLRRFPFSFLISQPLSVRPVITALLHRNVFDEFVNEPRARPSAPPSPTSPLDEADGGCTTARSREDLTSLRPQDRPRWKEGDRPGTKTGDRGERPGRTRRGSVVATRGIAIYPRYSRSREDPCGYEMMREKQGAAGNKERRGTNRRRSRGCSDDRPSGAPTRDTAGSPRASGRKMHNIPSLVAA